MIKSHIAYARPGPPWGALRTSKLRLKLALPLNLIRIIQLSGVRGDSPCEIKLSKALTHGYGM